MSHTEVETPEQVIAALRRKLLDYERWFRVLDVQMRVLERERQKLAAIVNHTDAGFLVVGSDLRIVWVNDVFARRFAGGADPGSLTGASCSKVLCNSDSACPECPAMAPFTTNEVAHSEIRLDVDGCERHIYATAMPIMSPEGGVDQTIVMLQDVSDLEVLKRSQEALRASEERFRSIFENAAAGMATLGLDGSFLHANRALCAYLGYAEEDLLRMKLSDVTRGDDIDDSIAFFDPAASRRPRAIEIEKRYVRKDGNTVWGRTTASWLLGPDGEPAYAVALVQDITDRKRLEEDLRQAEKMSAMGILVSGVAHELNNPLAGVLGYAQLLARTHGEGPLRKGLDSIHREAERCRRIVHNLQTFARRHTPQEIVVDVNEVLISALDLRAYQLNVDDIKVVKDLEPDLPSTMADPHQLQQVFLNIVVNAHQAIAASGKPGILTLRTRRRLESIVVEIEDNGPGIRQENLHRIFDPFFTTKEVGQGTGLGLSICYGIVKEHRGWIAARNAPSGGAVFVVNLPIRVHADPAPGPGAVEKAPEGAAKVHAGEVLVVDDEEVIVDILTQTLVLFGHRVEAASNGVTALQRLREKRYDVVISDLKMPGMGGCEFYEKVVEIDPDLARRIVFSTGDTVSEETRGFLERTGNAYLQKPFDIESLKKVVGDLLASG